MTPEELASELAFCMGADGGWDRARALKMIRAAITATREECARVAENEVVLAAQGRKMKEGWRTPQSIVAAHLANSHLVIDTASYTACEGLADSILSALKEAGYRVISYDESAEEVLIAAKVAARATIKGL
jgi:hypothetical protein